MCCGISSVQNASNGARVVAARDWEEAVDGSVVRQVGVIHWFQDDFYIGFVGRLFNFSFFENFFSFGRNVRQDVVEGCSLVMQSKSKGGDTHRQARGFLAPGALSTNVDGSVLDKTALEQADG